VKLKERRAYGPSGRDAFNATSHLSHNHFGLIVVSCERADIRPMPDQIVIYDNETRSIEQMQPPEVPRAEVADELYAAAVLGQKPLHSGEWGLATLEICHAILQSAASNQEVYLHHQI
jgi:phthalate 4,5-cis-dihydrodiol dehydrogenase